MGKTGQRKRKSSMNESLNQGVGMLTWNENVHVIAQILGLIFHILLQALTWTVSPILKEGKKKHRASFI